MDQPFQWFWFFLLAVSFWPLLRQQQVERARWRFLRRLQLRLGGRVITLIHRQEPLGILGLFGRRFITIEDSEKVLRAIRLTPSHVPIHLILHTPGGLVLAAEQIAQALRRHPAPVRVYVPHYAMSGGTLIALAADEIWMDENAVLGPVDPQLGQWPAASILRAVEQKDINRVEDETLILADVARKALEQVREVVRELLEDHLPPPQAEQVAQALTEGRWTHDYPLTCQRLQQWGLPVRCGLPPEVYGLMELYPQAPERRPSVQYIPLPGPAGERPARPEPPVRRGWQSPPRGVIEWLTPAGAAGVGSWPARGGRAMLARQVWRVARALRRLARPAALLLAAVAVAMALLQGLQAWRPVEVAAEPEGDGALQGLGPPMPSEDGGRWAPTPAVEAPAHPPAAAPAAGAGKPGPGQADRKEGAGAAQGMQAGPALAKATVGPEAGPTETRVRSGRLVQAAQTPAGMAECGEPVADGRAGRGAGDGEPAAGEASRPRRSGADGLRAAGEALLDLNSADEGSLVRLPGVGPVLARRIVEFRRAHGPFQRVDDLLEVPGIGPAVLEKVRSRVRVEPSS
ncbi:MAG TPA: helix-hairpin-helix domain-containing protein [Limnochordales bacterium]